MYTARDGMYGIEILLKKQVSKLLAGQEADQIWRLQHLPEEKAAGGRDI